MVFFDRCFSCARYSDATRYLSGGYRVCRRCADGFKSCSECGTLLRSGRACDPCVRADRVWNYSYKPDPHFHGVGPLFLGLELEIIVPEHSYSDCVALTSEALGGLGYSKQDSSIRPTEFELVTHPMSYEYTLEYFPWSLLEALEEHGCETDASVGLHVHASRAGFASPAHIYRWLKLLYRNESAVSVSARRRSHYDP